MSESTAASDIPDDIGRNDPCPCNSGRKYKKCCQRAHRLQKESEKKSRQPHQLVTADTIPWKVYKVLTQIHENSALGLFYEFIHDESPLRQRHANKSAFIQSVDDGEEVLPAGPSMEFVHTRLDPPDTILLLREDDPKQQSPAFQIVTLRPNEVDGQGAERTVEHQGFRIWDYRRKRLDRSEFDDVPPLEAFGINWRQSD